MRKLVIIFMLVGIANIVRAQSPMKIVYIRKFGRSGNSTTKIP